MHTSSSSDSLGSPRGLTFTRSVKQARHRCAVFSSPSSASSRSSCSSSDRTGSERGGSPHCWAPLSAAVGGAQRACQAAHSSSPSPAPSLSSHGTSLPSPSNYAVTDATGLHQPTSAHVEAAALQQRTPSSRATVILALTPASPSSSKAGAGASTLLPGHATPEPRGQHSWHADDKEKDGSGTPGHSRSHVTQHDGFKISTPASSSAALQSPSRRDSSEWLTPKQQPRPQQQLLQTPPAASVAAVTPAVHSVAAPGTILDPYTPWLRTGTKHKQRRSVGSSNDSQNESPMVLSSNSDGSSFGVDSADGSSTDGGGSNGSSAGGRRRRQPAFSTPAAGPQTQCLTQGAISAIVDFSASGAYNDDEYAFLASSSRASSSSGDRHKNSDDSGEESTSAAASFGSPAAASDGALGKLLQPAAALFEALPALTAMPPRPRGGRAPAQVHHSWQADTVRKFVRQRKQLAQGLYHEWNQKVFIGQLPAELPLVWNPRLLTTAGQVVDDKSQNQLKTERGQKRACRLELSPKVIDTEERLRDTLAHEMCHVGAWTISQDYIRPHGAAFQHWGRRFEARVAGIKITTCHSYQIHKAHRWQCQNARCARIYSRHAASIDPAKHVCGVCRQKLTYLGKFGRDGQPAAPKAPASAFSLYVKQHFAETKRALPPGTPHRQVMTSLGSAWKAKKQAEATPAGDVPAAGGSAAPANGSAAAMTMAAGGAGAAGAAAGQGTAAAPPQLPGSDSRLDGDVSGVDSPVEIYSSDGGGGPGRGSSPSSGGNGSGGGVQGVVQGIADFLGRLALVQD